MNGRRYVTRAEVDQAKERLDAAGEALKAASAEWSAALAALWKVER